MPKYISDKDLSPIETVLVKQGRIQIVGAGRATRYLVLATPDKTNETKDGIFLSADAKEIEKLISRPLTARHPVG